MKKLLLLALLLPMAWSGALAQTQADKLPDKAIQFIEKHFPDVQIRQAEKDYEREGTSYEAKLANGFEIKFDQNGQWTEVDGQRIGIPKAIVPGKIANYVEKNYPGMQIVSIDNERQHYEVSLSNGVELTFARNGKFTGRDR